MNIVHVLLLAAAAVCFALVALGIVVRRVELTGLGLLLVVLVPLSDAVKTLT